MTEIGYMNLDGVRMRQDPARDDCFTIVRRDTEMHEYEGTTENARREVVHRHMSNEITSLDIAAQMLIEFPDAPWELQLELARQCWDEARHVALLHRRLAEMGGRKGEFPISTFEWSVTSALDSIAARLATQNRTFEAGAMDVVAALARNFRAVGDERTAAVLDGILADEIQHVRFANRWIKRLAAKDPRVLMKVALAIRYLADANATLLYRQGDTNQVGKTFTRPENVIPAVNVEDRKLAEFSDDEVLEILKQAGFRTIAEQPKEGSHDVRV
jgi:uncharacterized ferritin-like protein (DUF455 family)